MEDAAAARNGHRELCPRSCAQHRRTAAYWSLTALAFALLFCVTVLMGRRLARRHAEKLAAGYQFEVGDIKWGGRNVWLYPLLSAGAGAMGGVAPLRAGTTRTAQSAERTPSSPLAARVATPHQRSADEFQALWP